MNRFKGIDLVNRGLEELQTEVHKIVQEVMVKTIPMKEMRESKVVVWGGLTNSWKKKEREREMKGKGEKERYIHLHAEFQRVARRDKRAFLSDQCKEIEENNRMGKTRDMTTWPASWEACMQVRKQQLELDMEQQTGSK